MPKYKLGIKNEHSNIVSTIGGFPHFKLIIWWLEMQSNVIDEEFI